MVEFVAAALIVSGFWMLLEIGRIFMRGVSKEEAAAQVITAPGREYVERYAEAFLRLAESYQAMPGKKEHFGDEEVEHIFFQIRERQCQACEQREQCWTEQYYETCQQIYQCLRAVEGGAGPYSHELMEFQKYCDQGENFIQGLKEIFLQERVNLMWNNRLLEQRAAAGEQIQDTADLLKQMAERIYQIQNLKEKDLHRMEKELKYEKIQCRNAWIFSRDESHPEYYVTMRITDGNCIQAKDVGEILSEALGRKLVPAKDCRLTIRREYDTFHYITDTRYQMVCGIARMKKTGELVSGDNFAFWQGDCGQVIMSLADGMGTGVEACRESEKVIELLEQFLDAGFSQDTAMRMINSSMVLQDHMRIFSTIDLCMVDLYNGRCSMIKAGACATYLKRQDELETISCKALPAGMLPTADYDAVERQLVSGDVIIMMTDGVLDALPEENREQQLEELLLKVQSSHTKEYARRILEQILIRRQFEVRDDMTVLVGQIWEK